jgi:phage recombination protein Bet
MNQVVIAEQPRSVLVDMSRRYGMEPAAFEATVRATCMRPDKNGKVPSREEFAAFLLVAKEYGLNPITKEIYAFTAKGGGIVPIVSVDGWVNLVNSNKHCDGFEFVMEHDEDGKLVSCTCKMYRKDRTHPVTITEYLSECVRATEPWAMKHRMLRHKAMIQAARYAFGFAGIYDEDEGRTIAEAVDVTPRPKVPSPPEVIEGPREGDKYQPGDVVQTEGEVLPPQEGTLVRNPKVPEVEKNYDRFIAWITDKIEKAKTVEFLGDLFNDETVMIEMDKLFPPDRSEIIGLHDKKMRTFE